MVWTLSLTHCLQLIALFQILSLFFCGFRGFRCRKVLSLSLVFKSYVFRWELGAERRALFFPIKVLL